MTENKEWPDGPEIRLDTSGIEIYRSEEDGEFHIRSTRGPRRFDLFVNLLLASVGGGAIAFVLFLLLRALK